MSLVERRRLMFWSELTLVLGRNLRQTLVARGHLQQLLHDGWVGLISCETTATLGFCSVEFR